MNKKLKPETIARLKRENAQSVIDRSFDLLRRTEEKAISNQKSIWPELLSEQRARISAQYKLPSSMLSFKNHSAYLMAETNRLKNELPAYLQDDDETV